MSKIFFIKALRFLKARYAPRGSRQSYSGSGEDIIMSTMLLKLRVKDIFYIDIGAHHPVFGNNTYLFYSGGGSGVLIEPNPDLCKVASKKRPRDICLNIGAGKESGERTFFLFSRNTRNTFSVDEAKAWEEISGERPRTEMRKILSLDSILNDYCKDKAPDVISIDTEGLDVEILSGFSWKKRPKIFCVEVAASSGEHKDDGGKDSINKIFSEKGYTMFARTSVNALFVDQQLL